MKLPRATRLVLGFSNEQDARRVMAVLPKRLEKYGFTLHPDKTRLLSFRAPDRGPTKGGQHGTFDFLGFTHYWGRTLRGKWAVKRRTASDRFGRALRRIAAWCRGHRHEPLGAQQDAFNKKLRGHYGYYGIPGNSLALVRFLYEVERIWHKWLARRSQRKINWARFSKLLERFPLPRPTLHRVPNLGANP